MEDIIIRDIAESGVTSLFHYAQIDEQGYCIGVSSLNEEVIADDMIRLDDADISYLGKRYDVETHEWTDEVMEFPEEEERPSEMLLLQQQLTDLELQNFEGQLERQSLLEEVAELKALVNNLLEK